MSEHHPHPLRLTDRVCNGIVRLLDGITVLLMGTALIFGVVGALALEGQIVLVAALSVGAALLLAFVLTLIESVVRPHPNKLTFAIATTVAIPKKRGLMTRTRRRQRDQSSSALDACVRNTAPF